jgi:hypothetical protein
MEKIMSKTKTRDGALKAELRDEQLDAVAGGADYLGPVFTALQNGDFFGALKAIGEATPPDHRTPHPPHGGFGFF